MPFKTSYSQHEKLYSNMKKELIIPSLGIVAAVFFSACSKNEVVSIADAPQKISFSPLTGKLSTKAMLDGTNYKATDPSFGTFAYYLPADRNADGTEYNWNANHSMATLYIQKSEVKNNGLSTGFAWTTDKPYYWPKSGGLTFFAYSPFNYQETAGGEIPITMTGTGLIIGDHSSNYDVDAHQETDLLVADVQKDVHGNNVTESGYNGVPVIFHHKLSQITKLSFSTVDKNGKAKDYANGHNGTEGKKYQAGDVVFELVKVSLNNLATKGIYSYDAQTNITEGWITNANDGVKDYIWYDMTSGTPEQFGATPLSFDFNDKYTANTNDYLLVLPQVLQNSAGSQQQSTTPRFKIQYRVKTYTDADNFSTEIVDATINLHALHGSSTESLEMNKRISYSFNVCLEDQQIYWAPSIVDWVNQDFVKQF